MDAGEEGMRMRIPVHEWSGVMWIVGGWALPVSGSFFFFLFFFNIFFFFFRFHCPIFFFFFFFLVIAIVDLGAPKLVTFSPPSGPAARKDGGERML